MTTKCLYAKKVKSRNYKDTLSNILVQVCVWYTVALFQFYVTVNHAATLDEKFCIDFRPAPMSAGIYWDPIYLNYYKKFHFYKQVCTYSININMLDSVNPRKWQILYDYWKVNIAYEIDGTLDHSLCRDRQDEWYLCPVPGSSDTEQVIKCYLNGMETR